MQLYLLLIHPFGIDHDLVGTEIPFKHLLTPGKANGSRCLLLQRFGELIAKRYEEIAVNGLYGSQFFAVHPEVDENFLHTIFYKLRMGSKIATIGIQAWIIDLIDSSIGHLIAFLKGGP